MSLGTTFDAMSLARRQFNSFIPVTQGTDTFAAIRTFMEGSISVGTVSVGAVELKDDLVDTRARIVLPATVSGTMPALVTAVSAISAGENHIGKMGGEMAAVSAEITRGTVTTAYGINQVVAPAAGGVTEVASFGRTSGGSGYITAIRVSTNKKSIVPRLRLHLFNASNATLGTDYASWQEKYADASKRLGYYDMPAMTTGADTSNSDMSRAIDLNVPRIPYTTSGTTSLYLAIETLDAFTPDSGQKITAAFTVDQN